ncbi:hypothetical protein RJ640_003013 [Escallonia rubra]|uniref:S-protein homolog n=1 Tax=Escallonia rubra TaxID=112253 RepID=A0AA88S2Z8_9ASTE|nr:hypothetical protein RJ640_003013 [Escallonia rubra]
MAIRQTEYYCCHYVHRTMHEVHIINGFTSNSSMPLVIWCKSNQGYLGGHALQEGDDYILSFETNFWQRTDLLFCTMKWDRKRMSFEAFPLRRRSYNFGALGKCLCDMSSSNLEEEYHFKLKK